MIEIQLTIKITKKAPFTIPKDVELIIERLTNELDIASDHDLIKTGVCILPKTTSKDGD